MSEAAPLFKNDFAAGLFGDGRLLGADSLFARSLGLGRGLFDHRVSRDIGPRRGRHQAGKMGTGNLAGGPVGEVDRHTVIAHLNHLSDTPFNCTAMANYVTSSDGHLDSPLPG